MSASQVFQRLWPGLRVCALGGVVLAAGGCGKKGPPLTPYVRVPARVESVELRRVGDDVFVTLAVPAQNIDGSRPADVRRLEVYAVSTDQPRPASRLLEGASLVGVVSVDDAGPVGSLPASTTSSTASSPRAPAPGPPVEPPAERLVPLQGDTITVQERLEPEDLVPQRLASRPVRSPSAPVVGSATAPPPRLQRSYVAVPFSSRGRSGPPSVAVAIPLDPGPEPPAAPGVTYSATGVQVAWEPSGGLLGLILDRQLPLEVPPLDDDDAIRRLVAAAPAVTPSGPTRYNVYSQVGVDPLQLPGARTERPRWQRRAPRALNPQPLDALQVADVLELERERCYHVRAVRGTGVDAIEGRPSEATCVRPVDVFPPEPPTGLSTVVAEGTISLIWEASTSPDVAGYVVLRGAPTDDTLLPVTTTPVTETRYVDRAVTPGVRYAYAVVAVDGRIPVPNTSEPSGRAEDSAR